MSEANSVETVFFFLLSSLLFKVRIRRCAFAELTADLATIVFFFFFPVHFFFFMEDGWIN